MRIADIYKFYKESNKLYSQTEHLGYLCAESNNHLFSTFSIYHKRDTQNTAINKLFLNATNRDSTYLQTHPHPEGRPCVIIDIRAPLTMLWPRDNHPTSPKGLV